MMTISNQGRHLRKSGRLNHATVLEGRFAQYNVDYSKPNHSHQENSAVGEHSMLYLKLVVAPASFLATCSRLSQADDNAPATIGSKAETTQSTLKVKSRPSFGLAFVADVGSETNIIRVDLPETLGPANQKVVFAPVLGLPPVAFRQDFRGDWFHETETPAMKVKATLALQRDGCAMTLTITNKLKEPLRDLAAQMCLQLSASPTFRDLTRSRTYVFAGGKPMSFADLEKRDGYWSARCVVKGQPDRENERPGQHGGWKLANASRVLADDGVICVTSLDGKWTLGTLWDNAHQVFNNPDGALACLHSDPMISQLAPEESTTVRGWMLIEAENLETIHEKLLAQLRKARQSEK
jgi:hypothetical protein